MNLLSKLSPGKRLDLFEHRENLPELRIDEYEQKEAEQKEMIVLEDLHPGSHQATYFWKGIRGMCSLFRSEDNHVRPFALIIERVPGPGDMIQRLIKIFIDMNY